MKIFYFGTVCPPDMNKKLLKNSKINPSAAPLVFETALMDGFSAQGADVEVLSFPAIPAFPKSSHLFIPQIKTELDCGFSCQIIPSLNLPVFKQLSRRFSSYRMLKKLIKKYPDEEKAVLIYSIYQPVAKSILALCKKNKIPCFAIVPDLPRDMFANAKTSPAKKFFSRFYVKAAEKIQGRFDGYVYLTEYMKDVINPQAPYTVVEGIANDIPYPEVQKSEIRSVMYAGALNEKMGVKTLVDEFSKLPDKDIELWLFGSGDCREYVQTVALNDSRIKYFGYKDRAEILKYERMAHLLVNLRNPDDEFTKYSFPSKTIEYMLSETPLLTTKLPGIPDEYYNYCYIADDIGKNLRDILALSPDELQTVGKKARRFILENKTPHIQSGKILQFMKGCALNEH